MTIPYNQKVRRKELIFGSIFLVTGIAFLWNGSDSIFRYGFLLVGLLHLASGFFQIKVPYIKEENGILTRAGLFPKTIRLSEVEKIRKFAGDYTLFSAQKKLKINSALVDNRHIEQQQNLMESLSVPVDETPPKKYTYR